MAVLRNLTVACGCEEREGWRKLGAAGSEVALRRQMEGRWGLGCVCILPHRASSCLTVPHSRLGHDAPARSGMSGGRSNTSPVA